MVTPHTAAGDDDLRQYKLDNWTHLALIDDDDGSEVTRIDLEADSRATLESDADENPIEWLVEITSGEDGIPDSVTLSGYELYDVETDGTALSAVDFEDGDGNTITRELAVAGDRLEITAEIYLPLP